jgi:hypothetical protein
MAVEFKTRNFGDVAYWCPLRSFSHADHRELTAWVEHYNRLGIRTQLYNRNLWVHMGDDKAVYDRPMPARDRA